jgi:hypothetical protein
MRLLALLLDPELTLFDALLFARRKREVLDLFLLLLPLVDSLLSRKSVESVTTCNSSS